MGGAMALCAVLYTVDSSDGYAFPVFVLAVLLIARLTVGYFWGIVASFAGVACVNFIFTYPYLDFDFTASGYPTTFLTFLTISVLTSALVTKAKQWETLRVESEKERMRANLLRSISHDIRTPLTSIIGSTSTILDNPGLPPEEQREMLENARDEAQWLIRVVENLLSITRIGTETAQLSTQPEVAEDIFGEVVRKFRRRFPDVDVQVSSPQELLLVPMDPILIQQVLNNLLENAVLHGETTSAIRLAVRREGEFARFSVSDNGRGIPAEVLPSLFDGTLKRSETTFGDTGKRNMGLGLSVCRAIVQAHGGQLSAKNLEQGAEFSFLLPLSKEDMA